jgi:hypothetical protein
MEKIFEGLGHKGRGAECVWQRSLEGCGAIVAQAITENQGDRRFVNLVIEAAGLEAILTIAVAARCPLLLQRR